MAHKSNDNSKQNAKKYLWEYNKRRTEKGITGTKTINNEYHIELLRDGEKELEKELLRACRELLYEMRLEDD